MRATAVAVLALLLAAGTSLEAQREVSGTIGSGFVFRPERRGSLGIVLGISGSTPITKGLHLRLSGAYERYSPWQFSTDLCPPNANCGSERHDRTTARNLTVDFLVMNKQGGSRTVLFAGPGLYHLAEGDAAETRAGLQGGLGILLSSHFSMEGGYQWIPGGDLASSALGLSLRWSN
jgi:hypothetical protein